MFVTGANGQIGSAIISELDVRGSRFRKGPPLDVIAASHDKLDISSRDDVLAAITTIEPDIVIHAAAFTAVDRCESEVDLAYSVNAIGTRNVGEAARICDAHVCYISTDYVFDGTSARPYREWDTPNPLSVYGMSKLAGELELDPSATVVRTSWVCGRNGSNMVKTILRLKDGEGPLRFVDDQRGSPSIAEDLAPMIVDLALSRRPGVHHVTNQGETTWFGFAQAVLSFAGSDPTRVEPIHTGELDPPRPAPRPANSVLDNQALRLLGVELLTDWHESTERLVADLL